MDTINELNPYYCRAYFQRDQKSENIIPVSLVQEHFQYHLKLLKNENVRDREITPACSSGMEAMTTARVLAGEGIRKAKVFKDRTLACQGTEAESRRDFAGKRMQEI